MSPAQPGMPASIPALKPWGKSPSKLVSRSRAVFLLLFDILSIRHVTMREWLYALCLTVVIGSYMIFGMPAVLCILSFVAGYEISFRVHFGRWRTIFD